MCVWGGGGGGTCARAAVCWISKLRSCTRNELSAPRRSASFSSISCAVKPPSLEQQARVCTEMR